MITILEKDLQAISNLSSTNSQPNVRLIEQNL